MAEGSPLWPQLPFPPASPYPAPRPASTGVLPTFSAGADLASGQPSPAWSFLVGKDRSIPGGGDGCSSWPWVEVITWAFLPGDPSLRGWGENCHFSARRREAKMTWDTPHSPWAHVSWGQSVGACESSKS